MFQKLTAARITRWRAGSAGLACVAVAVMALPAQAQYRDPRPVPVQPQYPAPEQYPQPQQQYSQPQQQYPQPQQQYPQDPDNRIFSCESGDGQRTFCDADTTRGDIRLNKQLGDVRCVEGYTWGREDGRVWVDRGCRAEFLLPPVPRRPVRQMTQIDMGTVVAVRTNESISADRADGRVFTGSVEEDVLGGDGQLAIPRGSNVELIVRVASDRDLIIDLDSVMVDGTRYAIDASPERIESKDGIGANERTGRYVGGGAALGAIIGAIAGGGRGAAIGAGVGAGAGALGEIATKGRELRIPSESVVTFRIERPLSMGVADNGTLGEGVHYHPPYDGVR